MSKAEEAALEKFPVKIIKISYQDLINIFGGKGFVDSNSIPRVYFQQGYEQAEKELELTWEDMVIIHSICADVYDSHRYEWNSKQIYEEVLRRFNKAKKEKE